MTYTSAANSLLARFETYLAGVFHPVPQERVVAGAIQSFYTWFFAFLRNAFICGVLQYLADASGSVTLQVFAIIAYVALAAYCLARCAGDTGRSLVARLRDPGRNIVRHRRDREGACRVPH
jgi:hypothetical protein